jgi:hypothetical protein
MILYLEQLLFLLGLLIIIVLIVRLSGGGADNKPDSPKPTGKTKRLFSWRVNSSAMNVDYSTEVMVRESEYSSARKELLSGTPNKTYMTSDEECFQIASYEINHEQFGLKSEEVTQIHNYLKNKADDELLSNYELAHGILGFSQEQCIRYMQDIDSTEHNEYFRFPLESIYDTVGDCDCKAILASSIFRSFDFDVAFAIMPGHAALAISLRDTPLPFANFNYLGRKWYYCETTGEGWRPGTVPGGIDPNLVILKMV